MSVARAALAMPLGLLVSILTILGAVAAQEPQRDAKLPNIVFILTDDEDLSIHPAMPKVKRLIEDQGTVFENFFVPYALCCPSRAAILRGQYPHNTGVLGNVLPNGGFLKFRRLRREESTVATWLQNVGYRTAFYGKYLNGYTENDPPPPGWDEWHAANNDGYLHVNYKLNENGKIQAYGDAQEDYLTDVIARRAAGHIRRFSAEGRPFFLHLATFSPHSPYNPATRHRDLFADAQLPRPPAFDEQDVSDKPVFIRELPRIRNDQIDEIRAHHRRRLQTLQSIDDLVETLVGTLEETGQLENTYIVYTSDNGFHLGLHRMVEGKDTPYEEDIRVPFAVRGPEIPRGERIDAMALSIDLAPTFAAWAGTEPPEFVDGRSLVPLLRDPTIAWRNSFLIQRLGLEGDEQNTDGNMLAIRTAEYTYATYHNGEREMYDLRRDPYQLQNIEPTAEQELIDAPEDRLNKLSVCRAQGCRDLEDLPIDDGV